MDKRQKDYVMHAIAVYGDYSVHEDDKNRLYYYNYRTDCSQWNIPDELKAHEGECMMKLMLMGAIAQCGPLSAHEIGNSIIYYFDQNSRLSTWERPKEWDDARVADWHIQNQNDIQNRLQILQNQISKSLVSESDDKAKSISESESKYNDSISESESDSEKRNEEIEAVAVSQEAVERFRNMLRELRVMPFTKWAVVLPRMAPDPRFSAVPISNAREMYEDFVRNRKDELKMEKVEKINTAKRSLESFLRRHFQSALDSDLIQSDSDAVLPWNMSYESFQGWEEGKSELKEAMAILPHMTQQSIWTQVANAYKEIAPVKDRTLAESHYEAERKKRETSPLRPSFPNSLHTCDRDKCKRFRSHQDYHSRPRSRYRSRYKSKSRSKSRYSRT